MSTLSQPAFTQFLLAFFERFFFVFGIVGFAVGVGLVLDHARMHRLFVATDQWVSMRRSTRWLAIPHDIESGVQRYPRVIGAIFVVLAAFSTFSLIAHFNAADVVNALHFAAPSAFVGWIVDCVRWSLVVGGIVAIAVGAMLILRPDALHSVEAYSDRWISLRAHSKQADAMHLGFDEWVESSPRIFGAVIAVGALVVVVEFGLRLFGHG